MTLHQLRIFESVARHLNLTSAASELHMSQPALSLQLKALEEEYGSRFYERKNYGVALTGKGRDFLYAIRPILLRVENVQSKFKVASDTDKSPLIIGGSNTLSVTVLPEILIGFRQSHPNIQFVLKTNDSHTMERRVLNSEVEVALITNPTHSPRLVYEAYQEHEAVAFVPRASPLSKRSMSLGELTRQPLVVRRGSTTIKELQRQGYELNLAVQCDASEAVKTAVQRGLGVGLLFRARVEPEISNGDLSMIDVPEMNNIKIESFIIYDRRKPLSATAQDFIRILRKVRALCAGIGSRS